MLMKMGRKVMVRYIFHICCGASSPKDVMSVSPKADTVFYTYFGNLLDFHLFAMLQKPKSSRDQTSLRHWLTFVYLKRSFFKFTQKSKLSHIPESSIWQRDSKIWAVELTCSGLLVRVLVQTKHRRCSGSRERWQNTC